MECISQERRVLPTLNFLYGVQPEPACNYCEHPPYSSQSWYSALHHQWYDKHLSPWAIPLRVVG